MASCRSIIALLLMASTCLADEFYITGSFPGVSWPLTVATNHGASGGTNLSATLGNWVRIEPAGPYVQTNTIGIHVNAGQVGTPGSSPSVLGLGFEFSTDGRQPLPSAGRIIFSAPATNFMTIQMSNFPTARFCPWIRLASLTNNTGTNPIVITNVGYTIPR